MYSPEGEERYYLGDWLVQPAQGRISQKKEQPVELPPRLMAVLTCLVDEAGATVSRQTFGEKVWAPSIVTDDALNRSILKLRKALGDQDSPHRFIETVPRRGYRLVAQVRPYLPEPADAPAPKASNNLPPQRSSFIGRGLEVEHVLSMMDAAPLVTLTGVGGVGKTRLSLAVAGQALEQGGFRDGGFFVELSAHEDAAMVFEAVAGAVNLQTAGAGVAALLDFLKARCILLVIDNCEHLIDATAALIDKILSSCPRVAILATSREPLNIEGEQLRLVPPLGVPDTAQAFESAESVQLFLERAAAVAPPIALNNENKRAITEICTRLDGIPLAIELAAARISHLSPMEIAARLDHRFTLLTGGGRVRPQRQQTLKAAVDWSYALLSQDEKQFLSRLSVFSGDFSLAAAEFICMDVESQTFNSLDVLASLVSKSLVVSSGVSGSRYRLLETIRFYAAERLMEAGESSASQERHCEWCLSLCTQSNFDQQMLEDATMQSLSLELENFRAAINWAEGREQWEAAATITLTLCGLWALRAGLQAEGLRRIEAVFQYPKISAPLKSKSWAVTAMQSTVLGDSTRLEEILNTAKREDMHADHLAYLCLADAIYRNRTNESIEKAKALFSQCRALADLHGLPRLKEFAALSLFHTELQRGSCQKAIAMGELLHSNEFALQVSIRTGLSHAYLINSNAEGIRRQAELMKEFFAKETRKPFQSRFFENLLTALSAIASGDLEQARCDLLKAGEIVVSTHYPLLDGECLLGFVALNIAEKDLKNANFLLTSIGAVREKGPAFRFGGSHALFTHLQQQLEKLKVHHRGTKSINADEKQRSTASILAMLKSEMKLQTAAR